MMSFGLNLMVCWRWYISSAKSSTWFKLKGRLKNESLMLTVDLIDRDRLCWKFSLTRKLYQPTVAGELCKISFYKGKI